MFTKEVLEQKERLQKYILDLDVGLTDIQDIDMMLTVFLHKSYAADFVEKTSFNERLEFLGDGILWAVVNKLLFQKYKEAPESKLTLLKIGLVREETLAQVARDINLGQYIFLWKWEKKQQWEEKNSILSDALEALLGFLYVDAWTDAVEKFIIKYLFPKLEEISQREWKSYKSIIQEYAQKHFKVLPVYETDDYEKDDKWNTTSYRSQVFINEDRMGVWFAKNKKKSQEAAAKDAYHSNHLH